jgi:hypothetical protein
MNKLETREQAEARALELFPKYEDSDNCGSFPINVLRKQQQDAYLKCWEDMQVASDEDKQTCGFYVEPINLDHNNISESVYEPKEHQKRWSI